MVKDTSSTTHSLWNKGKSQIIRSGDHISVNKEQEVPTLTWDQFGLNWETLNWIMYGVLSVVNFFLAILSFIF